MSSISTTKPVSGAVADRPVFFDPSRSRWTVVKVVSSLALVVMVSLFSVVAMRVATTPPVPALPLSSPEQRSVVRQPDVLAQGEVGPAGVGAVELAEADFEKASVTTGFFPVGVRQQ